MKSHVQVSTDKFPEKVVFPVLAVSGANFSNDISGAVFRGIFLISEVKSNSAKGTVIGYALNSIQTYKIGTHMDCWDWSNMTPFHGEVTLSD